MSVSQVNHAAITEGGIIPAVRSRSCAQCWAQPGDPCTVSGPAGDHLRRYLSAEDAGLISRADMNAVISSLPVVADHVYVYAADVVDDGLGAVVIDPLADLPLTGWAHAVDAL